MTRGVYEENFHLQRQRQGSNPKQTETSFRTGKKYTLRKKKKLAGNKVQRVHEEISHCFMLKKPDTLLGAYFL
jgi:hypothetical protein